MSEFSPQFDSDVPAIKTDYFQQVSEAAGIEVSPPEAAPVIWKYSLKNAEYKVPHDVELPLGATFCAFAMDPINGPSMWFLVDPTAEKENRTFVLTGTNHPLVGFKAYLANAIEMGITPSGPKALVTHLVELIA